MARSNENMLDDKGLIYHAVYKREKLEAEWPLLISSSGGGGHNAAIYAKYLSILDQANKQVIKLSKPTLPTYKPLSQAQKPWINMQKQQIELGLGLPLTIKEMLTYLGLPVLPNIEDIRNEIASQDMGEKPWVDTLKCIYPAGLESLAIWNVLQKQDKTKELTKLIDFQKQSDKLNYKYVFDYVIQLLENAVKEGTPYTKIISTQAMALPALCDAVIYYNKKITKKYHALPIYIHQYLTDIASPGAVHFLRSLERLTPQQRSCMLVYGVNLNKVKEFDLLGFAKMVSIDPSNNPMVRAGFYNSKLKDIALMDKDIELAAQVKDQPDHNYPIQTNEKVASVMLGSQASLDTILYVKQLLESKQFDKIFVFGGTKSHIYSHLSQLDAFKEGKIILLDDQDDNHIAPIMTRSQLVIIRGGGLSTMEQMAMPHAPGQVILVHCKNGEDGLITSGISWEDWNVDILEAFLKEKNIIARRTTPELIKEQLQILQQEDGKFLETDIGISTRIYLKAKILDIQTKLKNYFNEKHTKTHPLNKSKNDLAITLLSKLNFYSSLLDNPHCNLSDTAIQLACLFMEYQDFNSKTYKKNTFFLKLINSKGSLGLLLNEALEVVERFCPLNYKAMEESKRLVGAN